MSGMGSGGTGGGCGWRGGGGSCLGSGVCKVGYIGPHKGGRGEGRATLTALAVQFFFFFFPPP